MTYDMLNQISRKWKTMDSSDNSSYEKKGKKCRTMSEANMRFPISDKIIDNFYKGTPLFLRT